MTDYLAAAQELSRKLHDRGYERTPTDLLRYAAARLSDVGEVDEALLRTFLIGCAVEPVGLSVTIVELEAWEMRVRIAQ